MERPPQILKHLPRNRASLHPALNEEELETSGALRRWRSAVQHLIRNNTSNTTGSFWSYERLYKITDAVLVICALVFVGSSIASVIIWLYAVIPFMYPTI